MGSRGLWKLLETDDGDVKRSRGPLVVRDKRAPDAEGVSSKWQRPIRGIRRKDTHASNSSSSKIR